MYSKSIREILARAQRRDKAKTNDQNPEPDEDVMGGGAFCVAVYRDKESGEAIKVAKNYASLMKEWSFLSGLKHPNLALALAAPVYSIRYSFMRLELVDGIDLCQLIIQEPRKLFPLEAAVCTPRVSATGTSSRTTSWLLRELRLRSNLVL